jgi:ribose 5-phosphate isomerase B
MRIVVGADHAGFELKEFIIGDLARAGHEVLDKGTHSTEEVDFPDYARAVGEAVLGGEAERGILVCGSGVGACIAANKLAGIRASLCHDIYSAHQGVEHDDMNVLCLGAQIIGPQVALELVRAFLAARFSGEERYRRRLVKIEAMEREMSSAHPSTGSG